MDLIDYAIKLEKEFGVSQDDAIKAMRAETDDQIADAFRGRRLTYSQALDASYDLIRGWLAEGTEFVVKLDWSDLARFVISHRRACVWAVMTAKKQAVKS